MTLKLDLYFIFSITPIFIQKLKIRVFEQSPLPHPLSEDYFFGVLAGDQCVFLFVLFPIDGEHIDPLHNYQTFKEKNELNILCFNFFGLKIKKGINLNPK